MNTTPVTVLCGKHLGRKAATGTALPAVMSSAWIATIIHKNDGNVVVEWGWQKDEGEDTEVHYAAVEYSPDEELSLQK